MSLRSILSVCAAFAAFAALGVSSVPIEDTGLVRMRSGFGSAKSGKSLRSFALCCAVVEFCYGNVWD